MSGMPLRIRCFRSSNQLAKHSKQVLPAELFWVPPFL